MSCLVKSRHPNGTVYIYESTSAWDAARKMSVPKRRLVGKLDPVSGEIVPTGKRGRRKKTTVQAQATSASPGPSPEMDRHSAEMSAIMEAVADRQQQHQSVLAQVREDLVKLQELKVELKKTEAEVDDLIKAIQPLV